MYTIEMTTKKTITKKQKSQLMQSVQETVPDAECQIVDMSCRISGGNAGMEQLSYLLGVAMGSSTSNEIIKLNLSYEKQQ